MIPTPQEKSTEPNNTSGDNGGAVDGIYNLTVEMVGKTESLEMSAEDSCQDLYSSIADIISPSAEKFDLVVDVDGRSLTVDRQSSIGSLMKKIGRSNIKFKPYVPEIIQIKIILPNSSTEDFDVDILSTLEEIASTIDGLVEDLKLKEYNICTKDDNGFFVQLSDRKIPFSSSFIYQDKNIYVKASLTAYQNDRVMFFPWFETIGLLRQAISTELNQPLTKIQLFVKSKGENLHIPLSLDEFNIKKLLFTEFHVLLLDDNDPQMSPRLSPWERPQQAEVIQLKYHVAPANPPATSLTPTFIVMYPPETTIFKTMEEIKWNDPRADGKTVLRRTQVGESVRSIVQGTRQISTLTGFCLLIERKS